MGPSSRMDLRAFHMEFFLETSVGLWHGSPHLHLGSLFAVQVVGVASLEGLTMN